MNEKKWEIGMRLVVLLACKTDKQKKMKECKVVMEASSI